MLLIHAFLASARDPRASRSMGHVKIYNTGEGTEESGSYVVEIYTWNDPPRLWRRAEVRGFNRLRLGPWDLLLRGLVAAVGARSPGSSEVGALDPLPMASTGDQDEASAARSLRPRELSEVIRELVLKVIRG